MSEARHPTSEDLPSRSVCVEDLRPKTKVTLTARQKAVLTPKGASASSTERRRTHDAHERKEKRQKEIRVPTERANLTPKAMAVTEKTG